MKKTIIIGLIVILSVMNIAVATPIESLKEYYEADKNEDIDKLLELTDFSNADSDFREETKKSLIALAEIFDTNYYEITNEQEYIDNSDALVYYHVKTELTDHSGKSAVIENDFVAIMVNNNGWKIVYMQPKDAFEQNMMLRQTTIAFSESYDQELDFSTAYSTDDINSITDKTQTDRDEDWWTNFKIGLAAIAVFLLLFIFHVWMFVDCIVRKNLSKKVLWIILIIILGVLGSIIYFFTERRIAKKKES